MDEYERSGLRVFVGVVLMLLSIPGGLMSVWFLLGLMFELGGPMGEDHPSFHAILTHHLGPLLGLGGMPFAAAAALIFGLYLLATKSYFAFDGRDALVFAGLVALIPIGAIGLAFWITLQ